MEDCSLIKKPLTLSKGYYKDVLKQNPNFKSTLDFNKEDDNKFWMTFKSKDKKGQIEKAGKVQMRIDIVPQEYADKNQVGKAREEPNHSPFLPKPEGRLEMSLNPLKIFEQLVGPAVRRKIKCYICCFVLLLLCLAGM